MEHNRPSPLRDLMVLPSRVALSVGAVGSMVMDFIRRRADETSGHQFESPVHAYLHRQGYNVLGQVVRGPDGAVDLIATRGGKRYIVQCKRRKAEDVGLPFVAN